VLRQADFKVTAVVVDDRLIAVEPGDTTPRGFGLAFDLGTTHGGRHTARPDTAPRWRCGRCSNKQQPFGADVITRISATMLDPAARDKLQQLARETSRSWRPACARRAGFSRARSTRSRSRATPRWSTWSSAWTPSLSASRRSFMAARLLP